MFNINAILQEHLKFELASLKYGLADFAKIKMKSLDSIELQIK